jgi:hypothetical protein
MGNGDALSGWCSVTRRSPPATIAGTRPHPRRPGHGGRRGYGSKAAYWLVRMECNGEKVRSTSVSMPSRHASIA